ncbi:MAG TPA: hypothetical protein VNH83_15730 [Bryobacteraceae bacterium]|nr:hypothetical protein [Bryobacteraceae bacterium]
MTIGRRTFLLAAASPLAAQNGKPAAKVWTFENDRIDVRLVQVDGDRYFPQVRAKPSLGDADFIFLAIGYKDPASSGRIFVHTPAPGFPSMYVEQSPDTGALPAYEFRLPNDPVIVRVRTFRFSDEFDLTR